LLDLLYPYGRFGLSSFLLLLAIDDITGVIIETAIGLVRLFLASFTNSKAKSGFSIASLKTDCPCIVLNALPERNNA